MSKLSKNYFYTGSYQAIGIIIPLITTPYLTRHLGTTCLGIDAYVLSVVQLCEVLGSLGTTIYGNREIAYVRDNPKQLSKTFYELLTLRLILGVLVGAIFFSIGVRSEYRSIFYIQAIAIVSYYTDVSWLYIGLEDVKPIAIGSSIIKITSAVCIFLFIKTPDHFQQYVWISVVSQLLLTLFLLVGCKNRVSRVSIKELSIQKHLKPVLLLFLPQAASSLYVMFDKTMLGLLASDMARTSIYDKAEMIVKAPLVVFATALTTVIMPRIANDYNANRMQNVKETVQQSLDIVTFFAFPIAAGMAIVAPIFIPLFLGSGYLDSVKVIWLLSSIIVAIGLSNVSGAQFLIGCNETKALTISYFASAIFNIIGNYLLIPRLDELGASMTTMCAEWMVVAIQFWVMYKRLGSLGLFKIIYPKMVATIIMAAAILPLRLLGNNVMIMIIQIIVGAVLYFGVLLLLRDTGVFFIKNAVFSNLPEHRSKTEK